MMELCRVCQHIPFLDLPRFSDLFSSYSTPLDDDLILIYRKTSKNTGFPYHQDLSSLRSSGERGCALCSLVCESADKFQAALDKPLDGESEFSNRSKKAWVRPKYGQLHIAQLGPEDNGIVVFTDTNHREIVYPMAVIHIAVKEDSKLATNFGGRMIHDKAEPQDAANVLQKWMAECSCVSHTPELPTRVLDVLGNNPASPTIRLFVTGGIKAHYITLSHCWGNVTSFTTTRGTIEERKTAINMADMPKSFRDAVVLTRELGHRYLWIDSLCIIQQDREDWDKEGYKMEDIYSNAYLTIALAAAKDDDIGCLYACPPPKYTSFHFSPSSEQMSPSGEVFLSLVGPGRTINRPMRSSLESEPLSSRAWTFQERVLSPRTVFFGKDQMHFECKEMFRSEDGYQWERLYACLDVLESEFKSSKTHSLEEHLQEMWYAKIVREFSIRKITYEADRLPAVSGVAKRFCKIYQLDESEYVAGMWKKTLIGDLLWVIVAGHGPWLGNAWLESDEKNYHAPSWSWASRCGLADRMMQEERSNKLTEVVSLQISQADTNPFGRVKSATLILKGPLMELLVDETKGKENAFFGFTTVSKVPLSIFTYMDYECSNEILKQHAIFGLVVSQKTFRRSNTVDYAVLLVTPSPDGRSSSYHRVGIASIDQEILTFCVPSTITLI